VSYSSVVLVVVLHEYRVTTCVCPEGEGPSLYSSREEPYRGDKFSTIEREGSANKSFCEVFSRIMILIFKMSMMGDRVEVFLRN
jgi:hypothetical protein